MTLIKLEDVQKLLNTRYDVNRDVEILISSLPTYNPEQVLKDMISDAEQSMYPEWKQLDMKEFNVFSCGKLSLEIALARITNHNNQWQNN